MLDKGRLSASLKRGWRIRVLGRLAILLFEKKPTLSKLIFPRYPDLRRTDPCSAECFYVL